MNKITRITESDVKRILKKLSDKDYDNELTPFEVENPEKHGFKHMNKDILKLYVKSFGPITLISGKYACQDRKGKWECYDKNDRNISGYEIMSELDLTKYGFDFENFMSSYLNK